MQVNAYYNTFCFLLLIIKNKNIAAQAGAAKLCSRGRYSNKCARCFLFLLTKNNDGLL
jgi:hypothetical protein